MAFSLLCNREISIHALREEGDGCSIDLGHIVDVFLSTPSARRATHELDHGQRAQVISIHALCEEGDVDRADVPEGVVISIHALCEEGDQELKEQEPSTATFLSTPSARRATSTSRQMQDRQKISIHALCEEGDRKTAASLSARSHFYPRPLRGGRPSRSTTRRSSSRFLSTPSARRATSVPNHI